MTERSLKVWGESGIFTIKVPDDAKVTFGPWSPPSTRMTEDGPRIKAAAYGAERGGTLRIYKGAKTTGDVLAVFAGVQGFRDTSLEYEEEPQREPEPITIRPQWVEMTDEDREELAVLVAKVIAEGAVNKAMEADEDGPKALPF